MTSSIPMFIGNVIFNKSAYFENCITDPEGLIKKINECSFIDPWLNSNPDSTDCFDIKLNHARNNLYIKKIIFKKVENLKYLYIINSIKMAFHMSSDSFCYGYKIKDIKSNETEIYRQDVSSIFDDKFIKSEDYTAILFLNNSDNSTPFIVREGEIQRNLKPKAGSIIIVGPGMDYNMGYFSDKDRYYCIYKFKADII